MRRFILVPILCLAVLAFQIPMAQAVMYRWTDANGIEHISNVPPKGPAKNLKTYDDGRPAPEPAADPIREPAPEKPPVAEAPPAGTPGDTEACALLGGLYLKAASAGIMLTDMNDQDLATVGIRGQVWEGLPVNVKKQLLRSFSEARRRCEGDGAIIFQDTETGSFLGIITKQGPELLR